MSDSYPFISVSFVQSIKRSVDRFKTLSFPLNLEFSRLKHFLLINGAHDDGRGKLELFENNWFCLYSNLSRITLNISE